MKSASGSNLQEPAVPDAIAFILSEKETEKDLLYQYLSTTDLPELSLTQKDIDAITVNVHLKTLILLPMVTGPLPIQTNFQRARNRILYSQNNYETYTISEHTERIKHVGNPRGSYEKMKKKERENQNLT